MGDQVEAWRDRSPSGHDLVQGDASRMPTYEAIGPGGHPTLVFDGNDSLARPDGMPTGSYSKVVVCAVDDLSATNNVLSGGKGADAAKREFTGLADVYRKTFASDGIAGLYRGFNISFVGIFVYRGLYFGLYDSIMPLFKPENTNGAVRFAVGYAVTVAAGLASYPIDTIRRRMMMTSGAKELQYSSSMAAAQAIMKNEGAGSFFKGAGANILRGVAGAGVLAGFDTISEAYKNYRYPMNA